MNFDIKRNFTEPVMELMVNGINVWLEHDIYWTNIHSNDLIKPMEFWKQAIKNAGKDEQQLVCDELAEKYVELECRLTELSVFSTFSLLHTIKEKEQIKQYVSTEVTKRRYEEMKKLKKLAVDNGCIFDLIEWDELRKKILNSIINYFAYGLENFVFSVYYFETACTDSSFGTACFLINEIVRDFYKFIDNKLDGYERLIQKMVSIAKFCRKEYENLKPEIDAKHQLNKLQNGIYVSNLNSADLNATRFVTAFCDGASLYYKKIEKEKFEFMDKRIEELSGEIECIEQESEAFEKERGKDIEELTSKIENWKYESESFVMLFMPSKKKSLLEKIFEHENRLENMQLEYNEQLSLLRTRLETLEDEYDGLTDQQFYPFKDWEICGWEELHEPV